MPDNRDNMNFSLEEILNTISHGSSFFLATVGFILLLIKGGSHHGALEVFSYFIYSLTIILLFLFSNLFHNNGQIEESDSMKNFNRSSIYLLLAGTATPFTLLSIQDSAGTSLFYGIWFLAILGTIIKTQVHHFRYKNILEIILYILISFSYLTMIQLLWGSLQRFGVYLVMLAGAIYLASAIIYRLKITHYQAIGKSLSLLASIFIWFAIYLYI